jgi:hypothetical protein
LFSQYKLLMFQNDVQRTSMIKTVQSNPRKKNNIGANTKGIRGIS